MIRVLTAVCFAGVAIGSQGRQVVLPREIPAEEVASESPAEPIRLDVTVIDGFGAVVDSAPEFRRYQNDRIATTVLNISRLVDGEVTWFWLSPDLRDGTFVYELEEPGEYLLSWRQAGVPYFEVPVQVEPRMQRVPVRVQLEAPQPNGRLTVQVLDPWGRPHLEEKQIFINSLRGWTLTETPRERPFRDTSWTSELPPGSYRVVAAAEPDRGSCVRLDPIPRSFFAPGVAEIELRPGEEKTIEVRLVSAGHLDLSAVSPRETPSFDEMWGILSAVDDNRLGPEDFERLWAHYGGRLIRLTPELSREPLAVWFHSDALDPWSECECFYAFPGWSARSLTPIPVGDYWLEIESHDAERFVRSVEIRAGEVTEIAW